MIFSLQRTSRGASLATVMMVVAMMLTLGFTVVAISFNHLNLSFKSNNNARSKHLAEAVLAQAIDRIVADQEFGMLGSAEAKTVRIVPSTSAGELFSSLPEGSEGILTFDKDFASSEGIPHSTNNRTELQVYGAAGVGVPGESFHLVATGRVKNSTSTVEAILTVPQFPFSVASQGEIRSEGGLVVASVRPGVPYDLDYPLHEDDLQPGHMISNSKVGNDAVVLSGENKIYGDLQSSSGVTLEDETAVFGEVRTNASDEPLPRITVTDYDPETDADPREPNIVNSGAGTLEIEGYNKSRSSLTVDNGIVLSGGVLYVEGDVLVSAGGVSGKGAIISTGNVTIYGDGEATSDNEAAIVAGGNVVIRGSSAEKAKFAGLIYTEGQLDAENLRLAGVFVAAGDNSSVEFKNTEVYEDPSKSAVIIESGDTTPDPFELPADMTPDPITLNGNTVPMSYDLTDLEANLESYRNPTIAPEQPEYLFKFHVGSLYYTAILDGSGGRSLVPTTGPDQYVVDGSDLGLTIFGQKITSVSQAESVVVQGLEALEGRPLTTAEIATIQQGARKTFLSSSNVRRLSEESVAYTITNGTSTDPTGPTTQEPFNWSLDLSEFFSDKKRMEVVYWGEYKE
jgi:hypothetical protein